MGKVSSKKAGRVGVALFEMATWRILHRKNGMGSFLKRFLPASLPVPRADVAGVGDKGAELPVPPQMKLSIPLEARLRMFLFPGRSRDLQLQLVDTFRCTVRKKGVDGTIAQRRDAKVDELQKWVVTGDEGEGVEFTESSDKHLGILLYTCLNYDNPDYLWAALALVSRNGLNLTESHYNRILLLMNRSGWYGSVKKNFRGMLNMGIKCRLDTMFALAASSAQRRDFKFAHEVLEKLILSMGDQHRSSRNPFPMEVVIEACQGVGQWEEALIGLVLEWHRVLETSLSQKSVDALIKWIRRCMYVCM